MPRHAIAFAGPARIAAGDLPTVARALKAADRRGLARAPLVFDAETSEPIELDLRGSLAQVVARAEALAPAHGEQPAPADSTEEARGPGRPRLGVIGREVTLLPRHWDWLAAQPGGASAALRRLVDRARVEHAGRDRQRRAQEAAYRFMTATLGDQPGFEEATRALFANDAGRFTACSRRWPADLRSHARALARAAFAAAPRARRSDPDADA